MSSHRPRSNYKHPSGLPTLLHLSQLCIKRHLSQLQDVGTTPYHLLASVLSLMSAKQLDQLESLSTQLTPHSDELWKQLILKDFPDRPVELGSVESLNKLKFEKMPYKSLYYKYVKQRDDFRKDSAKRLRHLNESMNKEKARNKIVAVDKLMRDPSVRYRQSFRNGQQSSSLYNKNTILGKAIRESQTRSLMFGTSAMRKYDSYSAFKAREFAPMRAPKSSTRRTTFFDSSIGQQKQPQITVRTNPGKGSIMPIKGKQQSSSCPSSPSSSGEVSETLRKKRVIQQPSIFLQNKRSRPPSQTSPVRKQEEKEKHKQKQKQKEITREEPSKIKPLKSSIFS
ncbi:hypothetical protein KGF57_003760 [Candida theae]|uniref:Elongin-A n=1 Tax=Candida theae TaxID=1198502 RepID=A0AAD5FXM0_9ASCO|nr:uncharacterized protein KGF57_003760 [Candida theae]KAI5954737.1 hypothetical protein KGF57_003760 [Candida theae]